MMLFLGTSKSNAQEALAFTSMSLCNKQEVLDERLLSEFQEFPMAEGEAIIFSQGLQQYAPGLLTLYVSPDTLDFTVVMKFDDGISCVLVTGKNFRPVAKGDAT